jgi:CheY-like chemotaxis protein
VVLNTAAPDTLWCSVEEARQQVRGTPVVGCSLAPLAERALAAGSAGYLVKPVRRGDLEELIRKLDRPVRRVLVVDDDNDVLGLLSRMLRTLDGALEVVTASDGAQALEQLRTSPIDLVLLDVLMPGMDGWEVLERKRQDERIRGVPIIFLSARDPTEQPTTSGALVVTMGEGLTASQLLRCSLGLSELLLKPYRAPGPSPG